MVIDAYVRVSLVGIEVLTIDARVVIASVDTYLRFAEAVNRLDISQEKQGLPGLVGEMQEGGAKHKTKGVLDAATDKLRDFAANGGREAAGRPPRPPGGGLTCRRRREKSPGRRGSRRACTCTGSCPATWS